MRKNRWPKCLAGLLLAASAVFGTTSASAETVLLNRGQGMYGLGWLFLQQDGTCRIATPRHVIESEERLVPADILDRYGRSHATFDPAPAPTDSIDLAFLEVRGALALEGCSSSRMSAVAIRSALDRMETGTLAIATPFDRQMIHIERRATSRDADGGLIVVIGPRPGEHTLMQGMSGGAVIVDNRPVAMLIEVDTDSGTGIALRFDVIADELERLERTTSPRRDHGSADLEIGELSLTHGEVISRDGGVGMFLAGHSDLVLTPERDRIGLVANLLSPMSVDTVTFAATADGPTDGELFVEVADGPAGFVPARACTISLTGELQTCSFSSRKFSSVRITATNTSQSVRVHTLVVGRSN